MTQHEIKAAPSGKAPSVRPTCAGLGLAGRARAPRPLPGGVRLGMRRALSPPASLRPRSVPEAHPLRPGAYPGPSGARRSSRCCASSRYRRSWACWRRRLRGRRREGGGRTRSCTAETALCAQRAPRVTEKAPPTRRAAAPPPAPPPWPLPGGSPAPVPLLRARQPSGSPGCRPGTRSLPVGGGGASATPQATLLKVDGGRGFRGNKIGPEG